MPNFVKLDSKPFHPDTYVGPEQDDDDTTQQQMDALRERSESIKLEVENTVRWRWVKGVDGEDRRQSNSRVIRWSDGSLSLQLGKELFDVNHNIDMSGAAPRSGLGGPSGSQSQSQSLSQPLIPPASQSQLPLRTHGLTYLVAQHKRAEVLQAEKLITGYLTLRPIDMQSATHRKLVRAVGQKHNKVARLRMAPSDLVQRDPDKELAELAKNAARKPRKTGKRTEDGLVTPRKKRIGVGKKSRDQVWSDDEEEPFVGSEEESDDGLDGRRKVKKKPDDDGKKGPGEYQTDDFVVSDEEDDDEDDVKRRKRRSKEEEEEEEERDSLDEAEAKIAKRESKKRKKGNIKEEEVVKEEVEEETDDKMEVESEEDDQEVGIRKPPTGGRRRRVAVDEDDEE
ncbi:Leo1-domain-containing protein [Ramaria rubella]|nr:Leo1-domain-containing protein [Ramaria rubella]